MMTQNTPPFWVTISRKEKETVMDNGQTAYDLVLKGGRVIDPANGIDGQMDVAVRDGKIVQVAAVVPSENAAQVIDVSGLTVTPGILDIHTHAYQFRPNDTSYIEGLNADAHFLSSGVTTTVDTGSAGWEHFLDFKETSIDRRKVRILAFLNIARAGMVDKQSEQTLTDLDPRIAASLACAFPEIIVGIKTAHYWTSSPFDAFHPPWASVERAVEAGELCGKPVMVDFWPRPPERPYPDLILTRLRPGDIHTHVYAQQFPVLAADGQVNDFLFAARERGVKFDLGHGAGSFWFRNAVPALHGGFPPDSISTDLHMDNINGPVISMAQTMSKFLAMGMPFAEVVQRSTSNPAQLIGRPDLGTLSPGAAADIAVFQILQGAFRFADCGKACISGSQKLECRLTVRAGRVLYDPTGLTMPDWEQAPAPYWHIPPLQG
jgi:dihydroorotase